MWNIETDAIYAGIFILMGLSWYRTGKSPLLLASIGLAHAEAFRRQLIRSIQAGATHLYGNYRSTANEVLHEVSGLE